MYVESIFEEVLKKVKPKVAIIDVVQPIIKTIQQTLTQNSIRAIVQCGGSTAKDTYLADNHDCDLFVKFDFGEYKKEDISQILQTVLDKTPYEFTRVHGSRDYYQATIGNIDYEIVPVLDVNNPKDALNVTDMSPLHVAWVNERTKHTSLTDHIRIAKQFCKAQKVYGAESYIGGFSGHIIDILVIYYGGFIELLKAAKDWEEGDIIDPMNHYQDKNALDFMNESKLDSPLIIIDPILPERNAASALTSKRWSQFRESAEMFLENPSVSFFDVVALAKEQFVNTDGTLYGFEITPLEGKKDIVGAKCKKVYEHIIQQLEQNDFVVSDSDWEFDAHSTKLFYVIKVTQLEPTKRIKGPPLKLAKAVFEFCVGKTKTFEKNGFMYAEEKREFVEVLDLFSAILKSEYVTERVKKIIFV